MGAVSLQRGKFSQAVDWFDRAVAAAPTRADLHYNLGCVLLAAARAAEAEAAFRQAVRLRPDYRDSWFNLALLAAGGGRLDEAEEAYGQALRIDPSFAKAAYNLANLLQADGRPEEALAHYDRLVRTMGGDGAVRANRAQALVALERYGEAEREARAALALAESDAAWVALGHALIGLHRPSEALTAFARAEELAPGAAAAAAGAGLAFQALGQPVQAMAAHRRAIERAPLIADNWVNLGTACREAGSLREAEAAYGRALELAPAHPAARFNLACLLSEDGRVDQAEGIYRALVADHPRNVPAWGNLGTLIYNLGRTEEAIACFDRGLAVAPGNADIHLSRAMALLRLGRYEAGWQEYEWRWGTSQQRRRQLAAPLWNGQPFPGRTLLVYAEQGLGDSLQFCRFITRAAQRGGRVVLACQPPLVGLLSRLDGVADVVPLDGEWPSHDLVCPMLSLPWTLAADGEELWPGPYLHPESGRAAEWAMRLRPHRRPAIGLVWAGSSCTGIARGEAMDRRRSLRLGQLASLLEQPGVTWVSLQKGDAARQAEGSALVDWTAQLTDFDDSAALVANLDLVISVDTAVAHLAGGLGVPCWLLSRFDACWRWLWNRADSPWYPSMTIFRQPRPGDWGQVVADLSDRLRQQQA